MRERPSAFPDGGSGEMDWVHIGKFLIWNVLIMVYAYITGYYLGIYK